MPTFYNPQQYMLWMDTIRQHQTYVSPCVAGNTAQGPRPGYLQLSLLNVQPADYPLIVTKFIAKYKRMEKRKRREVQPYVMLIPVHFYTSSNMELLKKLLTTYGKFVAGIVLELPATGLSYAAKLPQLTLPALQTFTILYDKDPYTCCGIKVPLPPFIQTIIAGAPNLKDFGIVPPIFCEIDQLCLPPVLTALRVHGAFYEPTWLPSGELSQVEDLLFSLGPPLTQLDAVNDLFKKLPALKRAVIWFSPTPCHEFGLHGASLFLPENALKLTTLHIWNIKASVFKEWTKENVFPCVRNLSVMLLKDWPLVCGGELPKVSMGPEYLSGTKYAFPQLRKLSVNLVGCDLDALPYLFKEMTKLEELNLDISCTTYGSSTPEVLTSLLLGVTLQEASHLHRIRSVWEFENVKYSPVNPSLLNLKRLKVLHLHGNTDMPLSMIVSDAVCALGFMRMAELQTVYVGETLFKIYHCEGKKIYKITRMP